MNLPVHIGAIVDAEAKFNKINESQSKQLVWEIEAGYAKQLIGEKKFTMQTAIKNPQSLKDSIINVAAVGLSLNKALSYAYLVPRDGFICLDISYKGLVKLATDSGSIKWCKAELVRETDNFIYNGVCTVPTHEISNPFEQDKRGQIIGVYCIAKTGDGDFMVDIMSKKEIEKIRKTSKNSSGQYSPWSNFYGEMAKKSIIKRASKSWTKTEVNNLQTAIDVLNQHEGLDNSVIESEPVMIEQFQVSQEMQTLFEQTFYSEKPLDMYLFQDTTNQSGEQWGLLKKSFPTEKTKNNKMLDNMVAKGRVIFNEIYEAWITAIHENDELGQKELEDFGLFQDVGMRMLNDRKGALND